FIDDFIDRKQGRRKVEYLHPMLEPIIKETYGIIVYQEQVMKIVSDLGGFSLGEADIVRRAMGKKKLDVMEEKKIQFVKQAKELNNIAEAISEQIYDMIVKFASYGFNKSHSAAYSILSYQTAYLKTHFPAQFMASIMSSEINSPDRIVVYMDECKRLGLNVIPPDVNISFPNFSAPDSQTIAFGMHAIKNVGLNALESIVQAREEFGKFENMFQLVEYGDSRLINKKVLESLIQAGALDSISGTRAEKFASIDVATEFASILNSNKVDLNQVSMFGNSESNSIKISYPTLERVPDWSTSENLRREKELLGFYISGHPLAKYKDMLSMLNSIKIENPDSIWNDKKGRLGGMITHYKTHITKRNEKMAFVKIENFNGHFEAVIFPRVYTEYADLIFDGSMVAFTGKLTFTDASDVKILVDDIITLEQSKDMLINQITIKLDTGKIDQEKISQLNQVLTSEAGDIPIYFELISAEYDTPIRMRSKKFQVNSKSETIGRLRDLRTDENVILN
ncbi:MAG: DNA polymerase III subunit alpha, partial [Calditrichaeota bacterium]|nr:DNA polymerase III subunit alpha [Calditrichota bacterium]